MSHQELGTLAESYRNSFVIDSMTVFMIAIKAVKYFQLQRDLALLKGTLAQAIDTCTHHARACTHLARTLHAPWTSLHARRGPSATSLARCLHQAITDLSVFVVLLLVILLGFVIMASNIFGSQVMSYRDLGNSFGTLLLIPNLNPNPTPDLDPDADPLTLLPPPLPLTLKAWP